MSTRTQHPVIDWSGCDLVEVVPERLSGVPILKDTRIQADSILENYDSGSPVEEIEENFGVPPAITLALVAYARAQQKQFKK